MDVVEITTDDFESLEYPSFYREKILKYGYFQKHFCLTLINTPSHKFKSFGNAIFCLFTLAFTVPGVFSCICVVLGTWKYCMEKNSKKL